MRKVVGTKDSETSCASAPALGGLAPLPANQELVRENRLLHAVIDNFPGGILLYDCNQKLVVCNEGQRQLLDYPPALFEFGLPTLEQIFRFNANRGEYGPGDVEDHVRERMRLAARREPHVFERTRPNGTVLQIRGVPLTCGGFLSMYLDVTQERQQRGPTASSTMSDPLTDLPNWALFEDRFDQVLARVRRGQVAAIHFIDLDRFRQIQKQLGSRVAESLLKGVALRLCNAARATDTVARYGEDEFVLLQSEVDRPSSAAKLSQRIVSAIRQPFDIQNFKISIGASMGLALIPRDGTDFQDLINIARASLQKARNETEESIRVNDESAAAFGV
ncbi:MAG TPA: diguanylate cyclase [Aestuariivirga sp.]|nr:diguanylate cyclase [Alphaproteobacteria bacterium]HRX35141.1 diguanylate cyclase [Aestuariivirga sp.]